jgi:flagellin-like hook-associated protein FlgL
MLSNTLTLDDEEAVQKELLELQEAIVSVSTQSLLTRALHSSAGGQNGDKH